MSSSAPPARVRLSHFAALLAIGCLVGRYGVGWLLTSEGITDLPALMTFGFAVVPLLALLPAFLRGQPRSALGLALLALVYFGLGVANLAVPETRRMGALETMSALTLFLAATLFARWHGAIDHRRAGD